MTYTNYYFTEVPLDTANKVLAMIKEADFNEIERERIEELDYKIDKFRRTSPLLEYNMRVALLYTADRLITSYNTIYGLKDEHEMAYFIINVIDPELSLLALYKEAETKEDLKSSCFKKFKIYPPLLIKLEIKYTEYLRSLGTDDEEMGVQVGK